MIETIGGGLSIRIVKTDKIKGYSVLELLKSEIDDIVDSVDVMIEGQQRILLENIPSTEDDRKKLDKYKQLREDFRKVMIELI